MGIRVTRTSLAVGHLLAVLGDMPAERFIEFREVLLGTKAPETNPDLVPVFVAVGELMRAYGDDALEELAAGAPG